MAFLRFGPETCTVTSTVTSTASGSREVATLALPKTSFAELSQALGEIQAKEGSELRTELPNGWTIFWKIRDGESRFFVARPEIDQWVATLALSHSHLDAIRAQMSSGMEGSLSSHEAVSRMSNVEVILSVRSA